jgi:hypothetical protein
MLSRHPNAKLRPLLKRLGSEFDNFRLRGTSLIHVPVDQILYGFNFYPLTGKPEVRWLQPFGVPLYVPHEFVPLSHGQRIPKRNNPFGYDWVYLDGATEPGLDAVDVMKEVGLVQLRRFQTVENFLYYLEYQAPLKDRGYYYQFDLAGSLAFLSRYKEALAALDALESQLNDWWNTPGATRKDCEDRIMTQALHLKSLLARGDRGRVVEQLARWRRENVERFAIEDISAA